LFHPVTTEYLSIEDQINELANSVIKISHSGIQVIWLWPNIDAGSARISKRMRILREQQADLKIAYYKNFKPEDYANLLANSKLLIGNSSSGIRECAFLGVPSINIGNRQKNRERGKNVIDVPTDSVSIFDAFMNLRTKKRYTADLLFGDGHAGIQIAQTLSEVDLSVFKELSYFK
jgi:UDP-N-acetylglucosamine 2-epimerase